MGMSVVLKMFLVVALLGIVVGGLGELDAHYGTSTQGVNLNNTNANLQAAYTANVYDPLRSSVNSATQAANNQTALSNSGGFVAAFIIPQFGTIYSEIIGLPVLLANYLGTMMTGLNIPGINAQAYAAVIEGIFAVVIALFAISLWFKLPLL